MTQKAKETAPPEISECERKEVSALYSALPPKMRTVALGVMQELLARGHL
jgi:hypothetical protein